MGENTGGGLDPKKINDDLIPTRCTFQFGGKDLIRKRLIAMMGLLAFHLLS